MGSICQFPLSNHVHPPKDHISQSCSLSPPPLERLRDGDQGDLAKHAPEGEPGESMRGNADKELVQESRNEKDAHRGRSGWDANVDAGQVDVALEEKIDRTVPQAPVGSEGARVPPRKVESAVAKEKDLGGQQRQIERQEKKVQRINNNGQRGCWARINILDFIRANFGIARAQSKNSEIPSNSKPNMMCHNLP